MAEPSSYRPAVIPELPGVYRFFNEKDEVIYVGKALNLKNRLSTYFGSNLMERTYRMVHEAVRVDWTIVATEMEALALEFSWIKQYNPYFNIQFKDDKSYPNLAITVGEEIPRIFITRKDKRPGLKYFGPYTNTWALRTTFEVLLKVFPIRSCTKSNYDRAVRSKRQCLLGDIGKCAAPCVGWISPEDHRSLVDRLISYMSKGTGDIIPMLQEEMARASTLQEYERAAKIRDQIYAVEHAQELNDASLSDTFTADVIAIYREGLKAAGSIFIVRNGSIKGSRSWVLDQGNSVEEQDDIKSLLFSIYTQPDVDIPPQVLINEDSADQKALEEWLSSARGSKVEIKVPQRGEKVELLETVRRNAQYSLIQYLSKRATDAAVSGKALVEIEEALDLPRTPLRIECFDISNISGTTVVASMVVFEDGLPKKSDYRRFIIDEEGMDDARAIAHVITRRLKRLLNERVIDPAEVVAEGGKVGKFAYPPHLIVVDGGKQQVDAASRAIDDLGISDIALCGLAKRLEEVWMPQDADPLILPRSSEGLFLLQRIRDEAHRFAISFHRSRRSKIMLESVLDEIPHLGQVRAKALLDRFGSVAALRKATHEELAAVPGVGQKVASEIERYLEGALEPSVNMETGEIVEERK